MKVARFEKVSWEQFYQDFEKNFPNYSKEQIQEIYEKISLPKRATVGSAGYDIYAPIDITLQPNEEILVPTGIRALMAETYVLMVFPRSGLGFKYRLQMNNTVGIIDSDYAQAENEGHIFCKLTNDSKEEKVVQIKQGDGMVQGIFVPYGITDDDETSGIRTGGFGSTTKG